MAVNVHENAKRSGFSLVELLIVLGIMGLLGSISVGAYRAMVRGMEERGVMQNVNSFIATAYQRAQIDRQPVLIYFWNEKMRVETDELAGIDVGKAIAVRRSGRLTKVVNGGLLVDEFADWVSSDVQSESEDEEEVARVASARASGSTTTLYPMDGISEQKGFVRSFVYSAVELDQNNTPNYLVPIEAGDGSISVYGYRLASSGGGNVDWKVGMSYGFEIMHLELPAGYIFGTKPPSEDKESFVDRFYFAAAKNDGGGRSTGGIIEGGAITVSAVRQKGADMVAEKIAVSERPDGGS